MFAVPAIEVSGTRAVYASRIAFGNVSSNLYHRVAFASRTASPIYEKPATIPLFKKRAWKISLQIDCPSTKHPKKKKKKTLENSGHRVRIDASQNFDVIAFERPSQVTFSVCNVRRTWRNDVRGFINPLSIQYCIHYRVYSILHQLRLVARDSVRLKGVKLE